MTGKKAGRPRKSLDEKAEARKRRNEYVKNYQRNQQKLVKAGRVSEELIAKDAVTIEQLDQALDISIKRAGRQDPLQMILHAVANPETPVLSIHKASWALARNLLLNAFRRFHKEVKASGDLPPTVILNAEELDMYLKLTKSVLESKEMMLRIRKQKLTEQQIDLDAKERDMPIYNAKELEVLMSIIKEENNNVE